MKSCYIRPILYSRVRIAGRQNPFTAGRRRIMLWDWGAYLGKEALERGHRREDRLWARMAPNTLRRWRRARPTTANSALIKMEANHRRLLRGSRARRLRQRQRRQRQNIFIVRDGSVYTPPLGSVDLGAHYERFGDDARARSRLYVAESIVPREALYTADEVFVVGTAAEVTPIRSVDKIKIGAGRRGPITEALQRAFFDVVNGRVADTHGWLTYVYPEEASLRSQQTAAAHAR